MFFCSIFFLLIICLLHLRGVTTLGEVLPCDNVNASVITGYTVMTPRHGMTLTLGCAFETNTYTTANHLSWSLVTRLSDFHDYSNYPGKTAHEFKLKIENKNSRCFSSAIKYNDIGLYTLFSYIQEDSCEINRKSRARVIGLTEKTDDCRQC